MVGVPCWCWARWLVPAEPVKIARIFKCGFRAVQGGPVPEGRLRGQFVVWGNPVSRPGGGLRARAKTRI
jgi:hypothetical protein